ncbi:MAG: hypothetical protein Q4G02_00040 [bacterium]|nr:hypothetical protein [bacterium]
MKQGLFQLIYFTYLHNQLAIGLALAALVSLFILIKKPARRYVFFFIGFILLLLHFEYQKHIVQDLAEQTISTLFLEEGHYRWRWFTKVTLYHLTPFLLWLAGWGSVILGILNPRFNKKEKLS